MSDYDSDGDDWLYVEEYYDEADALAEHTLPSPPPGDALGHELSSTDPYDYWIDLEWMSDSFYDYEDHYVAALALDKKRKRKRTDKNVGNGREKRRKKETGADFIQENTRNSNKRTASRPPKSIVVWKSQHERNNLRTVVGTTLTADKGQTVALLKDWKERFKHASTFEATPSASEDNVIGHSEQNDISGEGFDVTNIQSIAGLLSADHISALKEALEAKGLDPNAVEVVLQDLIAGREPDFGDDDESVEDDDDVNSTTDPQNLNNRDILEEGEEISREDRSNESNESKPTDDHVFKKPTIPMSQTLGKERLKQSEDENESPQARSDTSSDFKKFSESAAKVKAKASDSSPSHEQDDALPSSYDEDLKFSPSTLLDSPSKALPGDSRAIKVEEDSDDLRKGIGSNPSNDAKSSLLSGDEEEQEDEEEEEEEAEASMPVPTLGKRTKKNKPQLKSSGSTPELLEHTSSSTPYPPSLETDSDIKPMPVSSIQNKPKKKNSKAKTNIKSAARSSTKRAASSSPPRLINPRKKRSNVDSEEDQIKQIQQEAEKQAREEIEKAKEQKKEGPLIWTTRRQTRARRPGETLGDTSLEEWDHEKQV